MRIKTVEIQNIRCFEHIELDLSPGREPVSWTLILGDNGVGKTTVLRSIALALSSPRQANALIEDTEGDWLRTDGSSSAGKIRVSLETEEKKTKECILFIRSGSHGETIEFESSIIADRPLVCGYGAGRREFGDKSHRGYSHRDSVATLFDYDAALQNPELILRRISDSSDEEEILRSLEKVLMLQDGSINLSKSGLEIDGPWGRAVPVGSLGDGYRAMLSLLLDFIGWAMLRDKRMIDKDLKGILLIDEIEQHLHPRWQRRILHHLHRQFSEVQFFGTTHAPLCVIGATDFSDNNISLVHLRYTGDGVEASITASPPRGKRADQVLTSFLFGLPTTRDDETKEDIERLSHLLSKTSPTEKEEEAIRHLRNRLNDKIGSEETRLEQVVSEEIDEIRQRVLRRLSNEEDGSVVRFEILRQIRSIIN